MIPAGDVTLVFTISPSYGKYTNDTAQKMKFSGKHFFSKHLVRFTEEILNGKPHFLCSVNMKYPFLKPILQSLCGAMAKHLDQKVCAR